MRLMHQCPQYRQIGNATDVVSGVTRIFTRGWGTTHMFAKAGIHHRNVYINKEI